MDDLKNSTAAAPRARARENFLPPRVPTTAPTRPTTGSLGEMQRARDLMERLLRVASPLGLYAEEFDPETRRHLGNFPQAFSHRALIEAAPRMIVPTLAHFSPSLCPT